MKRLEVYREGYLARTKEALKEVYETLEHVMGDAAFTQVAEEYAQAFPSEDYNLNHKGRHLSQYFNQTKRFKDLPFLSDLAALEWSIATAFHAPHEPVLDSFRFTQFSPDEWERLLIHFQSSVFVQSSQWPIVDIWKARKTPVKDIKLNLSHHPQQALIHRQEDDQVVCEEMSLVEFQILERLLAGSSLGEVFESLEDQPDIDSFSIDQTFAKWMGQRLITDCQLKKTANRL